MALFYWDSSFIAQWALKFEKLEKKLTNGQLEYLRQYYMMNKVPGLDELKALAKQWNTIDPYFYYDLDDWFFGRNLAEQVLERRRYEARKTAA